MKAFNNIGAHQLFTLARPIGSPDRSALPIAGDDTKAKEETAHLLDILGYDAVDIGMLAESWRSEPNTPVYTMVSQVTCLPTATRRKGSSGRR